jgi:hypothetical protein
MSTHLNFEFKTNKNGKEYCYISNAKTGKFVRNVSSKAKLRTAHKSYTQQKRRKVRNEEWESVRKTVEAKGSSRKQYEKVNKRVKVEDKKRVQIEKGSKPQRKRILQKRVFEEIGFSTYIRAFYQVGSTPKAQPYIVGESNSERDVDIEYSGWQQKLDGDNFEYNIDDLRRDFEREIEDAETSELQVFYGGYEITVVDNESGKVIQKESEGGYYPSDNLKQTQPKAKSFRRRSKTRRF